MAACPVKPICDVESRFEADIAGIGVIVAFLISARSSLLIASVVYVDWKPTAKNRYYKKAQEWLQKVRNGIRPTILMISDQQLVTGISIMSVAYIQHCTITQYHFYIVYTLGYIYFQVYEVSLSCMDVIGKSPGMKLWRAFLMTVLFVMVTLGTFIAYHDEFYFYPGNSTQCIWNQAIGIGHYHDEIVVLSLTLVVSVIGCWNDIVLFYPHFLEPLRRALDIRRHAWRLSHKFLAHATKWTEGLERRFAPSTQADTETESTNTALLARLSVRVLSQLPWIGFWTLLTPVMMVLEMLRSDWLVLLRIYPIVAFSVTNLIGAKSSMNKSDLIEGSENDWGFGQILPLFLLILPTMSFVELCQEDQEVNGPPPNERDDNEDSPTSIGRDDHEESSALRSSPLPGVDPPRRYDTEARIGVEDGKEWVEKDEDGIYLREKMFKSMYFRVLLGLFMTAVLAGSIYAAWIVKRCRGASRGGGRKKVRKGGTFYRKIGDHDEERRVKEGRGGVGELTETTVSSQGCPPPASSSPPS
ncbi:hypothetical protein GGR52DRAFT_567468 [Hypoxylon sp. FL1284]|nr:hypothetical protein GGR52DRAFT_567468 [Hypoxylon sp. FL1284]